MSDRDEYLKAFRANLKDIREQKRELERLERAHVAIIMQLSDDSGSGGRKRQGPRRPRKPIQQREHDVIEFLRGRQMESFTPAEIAEENDWPQSSVGMAVRNLVEKDRVKIDDLHPDRVQYKLTKMKGN